MLLLRPVMKLEFDKNRLKVGEVSSPFERLDTHYLVLSLFDYLMEGVALGGGRAAGEIVSYLSELVRAMDDSLDRVVAEGCAEVVLDAILNRANTYKDFEYQFFHGPSGQTRTFRFSLIRFSQEPGGHYLYKPTEAGYLVYLGMLDLSPEISSELMEKMLDLLVERGKFKEAVEIARRARALSIEYRQAIGDAVARVKRAPASIKWSREMTPRLTEATSHVEKRRREDERMLDSVREFIQNSGEDETRKELFVLREILSSSSSIRARLLGEIASAPEEFLQAQRFLFRPRGRIGLPDLEDNLLPRVLSLGLETLATGADSVTVAFHRPDFPLVYDFNSLLYSIMVKRPQRALPAIDDGEIVIVNAPPPQFPVELVEWVQSWLKGVLMRASEISIESILERAEKELPGDSARRCLIFTLYRIFAPSEAFFEDTIVRIGERRYRTALVDGTALDFRRKEGENDEGWEG
ncbi:MAG: hypothetical protein IPM93_00180 [Candidatus Obscuribacter sp.]|nr:hypothetical protein [Candidatus Obscuribacter sp.]